MKEKFFKDLGLDDDNGKMKKLENQYNLDDLFEKKEEKKEEKKKEKKEEKKEEKKDDKKEKAENKSEKKISEEN